MSLKNSLALALSLCLATPPMAMAQDSANPGSETYLVDVMAKNLLVTSIIYSATNGQAIVGVIDNTARPLATFLECEAPTGTLESKIVRQDLRNCFAHKGKWFEVSEHTSSLLDMNFIENLQNNVEREFKDQARSGNDINVLIFSISTIMMGGLALAQHAPMMEEARAGRIKSAIGYGSLGLIAAIGAGLSAVITGASVYNAYFRAAPSIEASSFAQYRKLIKEKPETPVIEFTSKFWSLTFDVLKKSIYQSVDDLNRT